MLKIFKLQNRTTEQSGFLLTEGVEREERGVLEIQWNVKVSCEIFLKRVWERCIQDDILPLLFLFVKEKFVFLRKKADFIFYIYLKAKDL